MYSIGIVCGFLALRLAEASWVDPDTPEYHMSTTPMYHGDDREYELVGHCWESVDVASDTSFSRCAHFLPERYSLTNLSKMVEISRMEVILDGLPSTRTIVRHTLDD